MRRFPQKELETKGVIKFIFNEERTAEALARSLSPDNLKAPPAIKVRTKAFRNAVVSSVETDKGLETFIETVDDLLRCAQAAERSLRSLLRAR